MRHNAISLVTIIIIYIHFPTNKKYPNNWSFEPDETGESIFYFLINQPFLMYGSVWWV